MEPQRRNALRGAQASPVCAVASTHDAAESEGLGMAEQEGTPEGADNPTPQTPDSAGAEDALRAAESSVEKLKQEEAAAPPASAAVSDKASAALQAAKAALAAAKSAQGGGAPSPMAAAMGAMSGAQPSTQPAAQPAVTGSPVSLPNLQPGARKSNVVPSERTRMLVEDVLRLNEGSVVELDKLAGDPVDVFVNERHVARGEVLVVNDNFCIRISEIIDVEAKENA